MSKPLSISIIRFFPIIILGKKIAFYQSTAEVIRIEYIVKFKHFPIANEQA
jgi:hypothetical protein